MLEWVRYPVDSEQTKTVYTYDEMYRLTSASATTNVGYNLFANYTYEDDLLKSIETASTTYNFAYGNFALRSSIQVGNKQLAGYTYEDRTNRLTELDYGNGDEVQYTYNKQGQVTKETYEDGSYVTYKYDNSGALATVYDSQSGITTTYYYDFIDRMMKYVESSGGYKHSVGYEYDNINNLTVLVETINGTKRTTTYAYDDDNRVVSLTNGNTTETYSYDSYGRLVRQNANHNDATVITHGFAYKSQSNGTPSNRRSRVAIYSNGYNVYYSYGFDDNGNISYVSDGTNKITYIYDSQNQLLRENNPCIGKSYRYYYDNAGNITQRREYAYTTGTLENPLRTVNYGYGDAAWRDLLTSYNGNTITYDGIGNPLSDGLWSYTWQHGRELVSMEKEGGVVITEQPEDVICEVGERCTFTVAATGTGLTYQWQYSYNGGGTWVNEVDETAVTPTFVIDALASNQASYRWRCIITDADGNKAISQRVERRSGASSTIVITNQPDTCYCAEGDTVSFTVAGTGTDLTYQWKYREAGSNVWKDAAVTTPTVTISGVTAEQFGQQWRCTLRNANGNVVTTRDAEIKCENIRWINSYNADGLRTRRTNGESTYEYVYNGGQLRYMAVDGHRMYFAYNAEGHPMTMTYDGTYYYYATNLQGDVIAILDTSGNPVVTYTYDAWGNIVSITGSKASTVGKYNPLRYRGYVYDTETKLYYLQSRYYNPEIGRFINADSIVSGGGGKIIGNNLFAYCFNNPVNLDDRNGNWPQWIKNTVKWVAKNIVKPVVETVQKALSKVNLTYSTGVNISGTPSAWIFNGQIGTSIDTKGNIAMQVSGGGGITTGDAGISGTCFISVTNAPNINKLEDKYYQIGGSAAACIEGVPLAAGGDVMIMPDPELNTGYYGLTGNAGFGTPGKEFHIEWGETMTQLKTQWNVFDVAHVVYIKIMEW